MMVGFAGRSIRFRHSSRTPARRRNTIGAVGVAGENNYIVAAPGATERVVANVAESLHCTAGDAGLL